MPLHVTRLPENPIIHPGMGARLGTNINGPSLVRVPDWVENPLGRYYLYFAHHKGDHIRLAYADHPAGPYTVHDPGVLTLADSRFSTERVKEDGDESTAVASPDEDPGAPHIASPDVIVDHKRQQFRLYFHGLGRDGKQRSRVATSSDGLAFNVHPEIIGLPYFRAFDWDGMVYAMSMPGVFYRSADGITGFEPGPWIFPSEMRHAGLRLVGSLLEVFWTQVGDAPERILRSTIDLAGDWHSWTPSGPEDVLRPENDWEGVNEPLTPSQRGTILRPVNQLRDPFVFDDDGASYLLYAAAGERGIAIAWLSTGETN
jgi:hypothetical protein